MTVVSHPVLLLMNLDRVHFPNHAEVSYQVYSKEYPNDIIVSNLIKRDMEVHLIKDKDIVHFIRNKKDALTLLIVGLCELHSNADMFGGIESTSFKIKYKQINKRGKKILSLINI